MVGATMAGPGIRYWHLARVLSREFCTTLAVPHAIPPNFDSGQVHLVEYVPGEWRSLEPLARAAQVVILPGILASDFPELASHGCAIVIDGYDPYMAEWLAASSGNPDDQKKNWTGFARQLTAQFLLGDYFICASERQRDWWLGALETHGRVNPWTFGASPSLRGLVDVVPFGLPEQPPQHTRAVIKGVWQGIGERDRVILWGGGLWRWLDSLTAIRAMARVVEQRPDVRLVFPGTRHPNPALATMPTQLESARTLASELGLLDRHVFFGEWVVYADWQNVLLESDLALTLHASETLEAHLAFRSRVLDYIWAGVPIIASRGETTSEFVDEHRLGAVVECGDVHGLARAIEILLDTPRAQFIERFAKVRADWMWDNLAQPLMAFCRQPHRAWDKMALREHLGNSYYMDQADLDRLALMRACAEITQYKNRRVVRVADWLKNLISRSR